MDEEILLDDVTGRPMSHEHLQHLVTVVGNGVGDWRGGDSQSHAALEAGRLASSHGRLEVVGDRVADTASDVGTGAAVQQHLNDGGMTQLAGEVQGRSTDAGVEVKTTSSDEHRRHLGLVTDDHSLQDVPAAVVQHFEDVVGPRTPT